MAGPAEEDVQRVDVCTAAPRLLQDLYMVTALTEMWGKATAVGRIAWR